MNSTFIVKKENLEVVQERVFDATREAIWNIISDPAMVPQWWGPAQFETIVDKMDFRVGGEWRFIHKADGQEFGFHGVYKEIVPNEKVSDTFNFEGIPGDHELLETLTLEDVGEGKTRMKSVSKYNTIEDLEGMVQSGMESGAVEAWDRLAALVEKH